MVRLLLSVFLAACASLSAAPGAGNVLVVINDNSSLSRAIGEYYARRRAVPMKNICRIHSPETETISRAVYDKTVAEPVAACLEARDLMETVLY
ncbi:MAG: hypothetical protein ACRD9L_20625, partial [Bryobacteraceae bacterium]